MLRVVGAVVAAYAGYKYGDDLVKLLHQRNQKRIEGAPSRKSLDITINDAEFDEDEDDNVFHSDGGYTGDSDGSTSLRKSKYSLGRDRRRSYDHHEVNDIPLYEKRNSLDENNVDQFGYLSSRSGNGGRKAYSLDIPFHPSSRKRDSFQENEGDSIVKEAVHIPAGDSQNLQATEPTKKWRRLSMEGEEKVSPEILRGLRSRFSFEADDKELVEHFRDLSCSGAESGKGLYAPRGVKQSKSKAEISRGKEDEQEYEVCEAKDPIYERELEKRSGGDSLAADFSGDVKECDLEEVDCMSEEIYSKLHNEIVGVKSVDKATDKGSNEQTSRPQSRRSSADLDPSRPDSSFQRWVSLRTGSNGRIVFWHSKGKLYDYLTGESLVNVEAVDVTRGVSLGPDVMHQLSERIFLFRDRDSNQVMTEFKGVPVSPIRHSFSHTWNASQTFTKITKGAGNKYESLKVNVSAIRQPNDKTKMSFNCRISLTVDINQGKFQWHEIGDYNFKEENADRQDIHHCSMLYMGAIPPLSHIAVMHLSGWRVDDINLLPASIKDHVQLEDISWIGQPAR
ncbi:hypothetical protein R1flu_012331 [Riccia fluitans]|uniref:Uncharacterized protein n=1 Tax=Riccia fluitans TaxID=41844 RepID=A0ABD1ZAC1_9MARC